MMLSRFAWTMIIVVILGLAACSLAMEFVGDISRAVAGT